MTRSTRQINTKEAKRESTKTQDTEIQMSSNWWLVGSPTANVQRSPKTEKPTTAGDRMPTSPKGVAGHSEKMNQTT